MQQHQKRLTDCKDMRDTVVETVIKQNVVFDTTNIKKDNKTVQYNLRKQI